MNTMNRAPDVERMPREIRSSRVVAGAALDPHSPVGVYIVRHGNCLAPAYFSNVN
jgi:hypothetical protein